VCGVNYTRSAFWVIRASEYREEQAKKSSKHEGFIFQREVKAEHVLLVRHYLRGAGKMGIFYTATQSALPAIQTAIHDALVTPPPVAANEIAAQVSQRTLQVATATTPTFSAWRFGAAVLISVALLLAAIWTAKTNLPDISKALMTAFASFSGIVVGALGGEAQKSVN